MFRFILPLISVFIASFISINAANAGFVPGANIAMTGANSEVQFDVADDLVGFDAVGPSFISASSTFTGAFYASGIGWIEFHTGSYTVGLDCGTQFLSGLTANCNLTNTGWSENIGEIGFAGVRYNPITGLLEGKISSNMGDIDLTGIILPLKPVEINETSFIANHISTISVKNAEQYESTISPWGIAMKPMGTTQPQLQTDIHGVFSVDTSIASFYEIIITDPNSSTTTSIINVSNNVPTKSLITGSHFLDDFCTKILLPDNRCPDGATKSATTLTQSPTGPVFANGNDKYTITHKIRDGYGNRVSSGDLKVEYITSIKNVQVDESENLDIFIRPNNFGSGDAVVGDFYNIAGYADKTYLVGGSDIVYTIASTAPSNPSNEIILKKITYSSGSAGTDLGSSSPEFKFDPIFTASVSSSSDPIVGVPQYFSTNIIKKDPLNMTPSITPSIISLFQVGDEYGNGIWKDFASNPAADCVAYPSESSTGLCEGWEDSLKKSVLTTTSDTSFGFTGTYTEIYPPNGNTQIQNYIHYTISGKEIFYKSIQNPPIGTAKAPSERVKTLGTTSNGLNGTEARVRLIDSIRKQSKLLSRNRDKYPANPNAYNDADVLIVEDQDFTIPAAGNIFTGGGSHGKAKRAIIVIGGDIIINNTIDVGTHPIALIALSNMSNLGGNIHIKGTVTDIHSTLVAERAILSDTSDNQLYIHGTVVSANPPKESEPTACPYFVPVCTITEYDLPLSRKGFTTPSSGGSAYTAPIVIEADSRLLGNSPSILKQ